MAQIFNTVRRIASGFGSLETLGDEIKRLKGTKVLIVTDPGIKSAGLVEIVAAILDRAKINYHFFTEVEPDPKIEVVFSSLAAAKNFGPNLIVGLGGGSSLDISKVTSVMMTNAGPIEKYFGMELVPEPGIPLILIPTTAGTGSEMTSICVLSDTENKVKKGIVSEHMFARTALLDPQLTLGLPPHITATTGMDALVHAIESFTGVRATIFTDTLNLQAIYLVARNLRKAYAHGENREARENMLNASCLAGMAFSNTQNGLDHALALAIGGKFHLPHGLLTAFILPWVMEYNLLANPEKFIQIARAFGETPDGLPEVEGARLSVRAIKSLLDDLGISYKLSDYGVPQEEIPAIAKAAIGAVRLISNNPRKVLEKEVIKLLEGNY
ncbi:MAG: iron-containing alcohol dehydrogenase [Deltaproteobacteria bacterium]|nr:iron-containing alcohol dehydrogenase [Deltaproteobacteria bacterium]